MFEPRLETSSKHTPQNLPKDLLAIVRESLTEKYSAFLSNKDLLVEGAIYPEEFVVLVGFKNKNSIRQFNFECSINYSAGLADGETIISEGDNVLEKLHTAFDSLDSSLEEYVKSYKEHGDDDTIDETNEIQWPLTWTEYTFEKQTVYLKTTTTNTELEKITMAFLKEHSPEQLAPIEDFTSLN